LKKAFDDKFYIEVDVVKDKHNELWKQVTGGDLMNSKFIANEVFLRQCQKKLVWLDLKIRELILSINKC
jgi:hypothetical protein